MSMNKMVIYTEAGYWVKLTHRDGAFETGVTEVKAYDRYPEGNPFAKVRGRIEYYEATDGERHRVLASAARDGEITTSLWNHLSSVLGEEMMLPTRSNNPEQDRREREELLDALQDAMDAIAAIQDAMKALAQSPEYEGTLLHVERIVNAPITLAGHVLRTLNETYEKYVSREQGELPF